MIPDPDPEIAAVLDSFPPDARAGVMQLRALVFETAAGIATPPQVTEALRWGQPAYLAPKGSTLRLGVPKHARFGLFVHCQSRLIPEYREMFADRDRIEGTRAILFDGVDEIDPERHGWLIARALTYHR